MKTPDSKYGSRESIKAPDSICGSGENMKAPDSKCESGESMKMPDSKCESRKTMKMLDSVYEPRQNMKTPESIYGPGQDMKARDRVYESEESIKMPDKIYEFTAEKMDVGYDGRPLIREITFLLKKGEILTLIGPNGAGKSTILKSITRQLKLLGGVVTIDGKQMSTMSGNELARRQAVVLTERIRPEMMTCREVVSTGRYPYTGTLGLLGEEDKKKVTKALQKVHALELEDRDFNAVSDGQKQRILLARAICQEPELIILDEPTSFLDIRHKLEFLSILRRMVQEQGVSVIMSLHELDLAQKISDHILCVNGPVIDRFGTPEEIFTSDYIQNLYDLNSGSYDTLFGSMELPPPEGDPQVFVICGGGSGIPTFRRLQRNGIPFAAGILQKNDTDYAAARHLATRVISAAPYQDIPQETYQEAARCLLACRQVLCPLTTFGPQNHMNKKLRELAVQEKLLT